MENLIQKFRERGIAVTPQRLAVLEVLQSRRDHPSAEHIYQEVRRRLPAISFNTVYKSLEVLCQKGMAIKVNPLHDVARYDGETGPHVHLICRQCHQIFDVEGQPGAVAPRPAAELHGFQVEHACLTYWGLCPPCQSGQAREED